MIVVCSLYHVANVDLLSNRLGVIEFRGILFTVFYFNVYVFMIPRRCIFLRGHVLICT